MSWKLQGLVGERVCGSITRKMVLLNMASRANDDGSGVYASLPMIAGWCEVDARTVRRVVRDLEAEGLIVQCGWKAVKNGHIHEWSVTVELVEKLPLYKDEVAAKRQAKASKSVRADTVSGVQKRQCKTKTYGTNGGHDVRADTKSGRTQNPMTEDTVSASSILEPIPISSEAKASSEIVALEDFRLSPPAPPPASKRGSRLPENWTPGRKGIAYAVMHGVTGNWQKAMIANFVGYWSNVPGQKGLKLNWDRAWTNAIDAEVIAQRHKPNTSGTRRPQPRAIPRMAYTG